MPSVSLYYRHLEHAIVTYTGGGDTIENDGYSIGNTVLHLYAKKFGYSVLHFNRSTLPTFNDSDAAVKVRFGGFQHHWTKPLLLHYLIGKFNYDWFVYLDTDIVITNPNISFGSLIERHGSHDLIVSNDIAGINNGVFLVKNSLWSQDFIKLWWDQRPSIPTSVHDNWPFMHALLITWSKNAGYHYNNECSLSSRRMQVFIFFHACYKKHLAAMGNQSSHESCKAPCGSSRNNDPNIIAVWDFNLGIGFSHPNDWRPGSFLVHFAGRTASERNSLMLEHGNKTLKDYF